jgi:hypothetical protein
VKRNVKDVGAGGGNFFFFFFEFTEIVKKVLFF